MTEHKFGKVVVAAAAVASLSFRGGGSRVLFRAVDVVGVVVKLVQGESQHFADDVFEMIVVVVAVGNAVALVVGLW